MEDKATTGPLVFSSRTSRWFYVFWALMFLLFIILDSSEIIPENVSKWILIIIVVFPVGVFSNIAYGRYQNTIDFFISQDIKSFQQYKWVNFEGYEVRHNSILRQIFTSAPSNTLQLYFSGEDGKLAKETVFNTDPQLIQVLDTHIPSGEYQS